MHESYMLRRFPKVFGILIKQVRMTMSFPARPDSTLAVAGEQGCCRVWRISCVLFLFLQMLYFDRYTKILAPSLSVLNDDRLNLRDAMSG